MNMLEGEEHVIVNLYKLESLSPEVDEDQKNAARFGMTR